MHVQPSCSCCMPLCSMAIPEVHVVQARADLAIDDFSG